MTLLLQERTVVLQPSLVRRLGIIEAAIVQQLHYWAQKATRVHDGESWVYKTYGEWSDEIGVTSKAARGALDRLRKAGVVVAIQNPSDPRDRTLWWRIDHEILDPGSPSAPGGSPADPDGISRAPVPSPPTEAQGEPGQEKTSKTAAAATGAEVDRLFAFWQTECSHPQAKLTRERRAKIVARLREGYTPRQIAEGIRGAARAAYVDESGKRHDDLELICRNGSKLESFIDRAGLPSRSNVTPMRGRSHGGRPSIAEIMAS